MVIKIFEACIEKITRVTSDSKGFRDRGEGSLYKSIRIVIDENNDASSVVAYNGHENILNALVNEIPSVVHKTNNNVVLAQLHDVAFFKDGIFRRFYIYFSDRTDAQKFCKLYNRESSMVRKIKKRTDYVENYKMTCKEVQGSSRYNEVRKGFIASCQNEIVDATSGDDSENEKDSNCETSSVNSSADNIDLSGAAQEYEDVEELFEDFGFDDNTQTWPQEPLKPFGNFKY